MKVLKVVAAASAVVAVVSVSAQVCAGRRNASRCASCGTTEWEESPC